MVTMPLPTGLLIEYFRRLVYIYYSFLHKLLEQIIYLNEVSMLIVYLLNTIPDSEKVY